MAKPAEKLTPDLTAAIRDHKPDILAALANEDAAEYVAERSAICEADGLPPAHLRPVFEYCLADYPGHPLIMLGRVGQTLVEARASLRDRLGASRVLSVEFYQWPPKPGVLH